MTSKNQHNFSIDVGKHRKALNYLDKWKQNKANVSDKICRGIEKVGDEEQQPTLESHIQHETPLDILPRIWEVLTKEDLEKLSDKDISRLYKIMHVNMDTVRKFIDSYELKPQSLIKD